MSSDVAEHLHEFWRNVAREQSRFHAADLPLISHRQHSLASDRAPEPFFGDLSKAKVFFLTFNPHHPSDSLNTRWNTFCYEMMVGKSDLKSFHDSADERALVWLSRNTGAFANRFFDGIVNLRLFAYASESMACLGEARSVVGNLPSVMKMREIVHDILVPKARAGQVCLLVMRATEEWGFGKVTADVVDNGLFISRPLRVASISPTSRVGWLVQSFLK